MTAFVPAHRCGAVPDLPRTMPRRTGVPSYPDQAGCPAEPATPSTISGATGNVTHPDMGSACRDRGHSPFLGRRCRWRGGHGASASTPGTPRLGQDQLSGRWAVGLPEVQHEGKFPNGEVELALPAHRFVERHSRALGCVHSQARGPSPYVPDQYGAGDSLAAVRGMDHELTPTRHYRPLSRSGNPSEPAATPRPRSSGALSPSPPACGYCPTRAPQAPRPGPPQSRHRVAGTRPGLHHHRWNPARRGQRPETLPPHHRPSRP